MKDALTASTDGTAAHTATPAGSTTPTSSGLPGGTLRTGDIPSEELVAGGVATAGDQSELTVDLTLSQDEPSRERAAQLSVPQALPPSEVPGYRILRHIGEGKYGTVWLARELNTGKQVAIKFYTHRRGVDWSLLSREVEKLAVLYTSRSIVGLLAVGWDHDPPYYVMEYLEHGSLAARLQEGPVSVAEAVRLVTRVAQALVHAHGCGILHCDLKPANILLDQDFEPRLCDFGQSRLIDDQTPALGTLYYMAPEQADLKAVPDARWDVYALGAMLYHLLCGAPPFRNAEHERILRQAGTLEERLARYRKIVQDGPRPILHRKLPGVDPLLADIVDRCLAPEPQRRFSNAQALLDRLISRERYRARGPLRALAMVLPLLLLLGLTPIAWGALNDAIATTRTNLTSRALESDALSVGLLAKGLEWELTLRLNELVDVASQPQVRKLVEELAMRPREERLPLGQLLEAQRAQLEGRRIEMGRTADSSWFLCDSQGIQRWREPTSDTIDRNFVWRDYFHGQNQDFADTRAPGEVPPIREPHISTLYRSTSTRQYTLAMSVPVWSADGSRVVGVLARAVFLSDLLKVYEEGLGAELSGGVARRLALVDTRDWALLAHPWMTEKRLSTLTTEEATRLYWSGANVEQARQLIAADREQVRRRQLDRMEEYRDPVGELDADYAGTWLAAFHPIGHTSWIAIVQERRSAVWRPVEELRSRLIGTGVAGIVVLIGLVAGTSWLMVWLLSGHPRHGKWWGRDEAGGLSTAGTITLSMTSRGGESV